MIRIFIGALLAAAINGPVDAQQRNRATGPVIFHAAANGSDTDNDCLSAANPCTPQGAHAVAMNNWDFAHWSCLIQLADGTYTSNVGIAGQYVGTHLCDLLGKVDSQGNCIDRNAVVFNVPPGHVALNVEDGMIASIGRLTVTGGGVGFHGRQFVIFDIVDVDCGRLSVCIRGASTLPVTMGLAHRGATAAATTSASMRPSIACMQSNRREQYVQMPAKIARSAARPPFGLPEMLVAVHTSRLSCREAEKAPILTPVQESSGESKTRPPSSSVRTGWPTTLDTIYPHPPDARLWGKNNCPCMSACTLSLGSRRLAGDGGRRQREDLIQGRRKVHFSSSSARIHQQHS